MNRAQLLLIAVLLFAVPAQAQKFKPHSIAGNKLFAAPGELNASFICEKPELVPIYGDYYLLSLPFRLETDANYKHVEHHAILRLTPNFNWQNYKKAPNKLGKKAVSQFAYSDLLVNAKAEIHLPRIISVFPTRQVLAVTCDRVDTITETFEPKFNGGSTGSVTATQKMDSQWNMNQELALGSFDNELAQIAFEYLPAKNQKVPTGIMTGYAVVEIPQGSYLWVSPYQGTRTSKFFGLMQGKQQTLASPGKVAEVKNYSLLEYAQLHNAELSIAGVKFLSDLNSYKQQNIKTKN